MITSAVISWQYDWSDKKPQKLRECILNMKIELTPRSGKIREARGRPATLKPVVGSPN